MKKPIMKAPDHTHKALSPMALCGPQARLVSPKPLNPKPRVLAREPPAALRAGIPGSGGPPQLPAWA